MVLSNFKVMTGTLKKLEQLKIRKLRYAVKAVLLASPRYKADFLVRNPYQKLQSCFRSKFCQHSLISKSRDWQRYWINALVLAHRRLLSWQEYIHMASADSLSDMEWQKIKRLSMELKFEDFVATLPACHPYDGHIWPQYWLANPSRYIRDTFPGKLALRQRWRKRFYSLLLPRSFPRVELRILHLEDASELALLGRAIGCDLSSPAHRQHSTAHMSHLQEETRYSRESLAIVNEVYKEDFRRLGYRMYNDPEALEVAGAFAPIRPRVA